MSVDITALATELVKQFKNSVNESVTSNSPDIIAAATSYAANGEQRLKDTAVNALNGDLSYSFVVLRLKEEEITLKDSLIGLEQMAAADITTLVNKLIGIFEGLLKTAILSLNRQ